MRFLRTDEVERRAGLSRTTIWRLERKGQFPARRRIGPNAVGWLEEEIDAWIESRPTVISGVDGDDRDDV